jgi:hypothetical protein
MINREPIGIKVFWDTQDPQNQQWAYEAWDNAGTIASGPLEGIEDDDIESAISWACSELGVDISLDEWWIEPHVDGGFAKWLQTQDDLC